ncbi:MAG: hypothetical protein PHW15_01975 [Patescibacteria group bacterium]|jgi:hypothetical protein|nr:hypothetical protein [Patescibacteria group bacterium]MDD5172628.1 hypothetical protein [Patescibacteria group bacterium]
MENENKYQEFFRKSKEIFSKNKEIYCPYFDCKVTFNSDGFHHLRYSARRERDKNEQIFKFSFLPAAIKIIQKSGTVQEYRKDFIPIKEKKNKSELVINKIREYWGFIAIVGKEENMIRIKVVIRRVGDGKIIFWSIMPAMDLKGNSLDRIRRLATRGINEE